MTNNQYNPPVFITNVSMAEVAVGNHYDAGPNSMLIQIVDPGMEFPVPVHQFARVHQFEFLDLEEEDHADLEELKISDDQARQIAILLRDALAHRMNVVVHCVAGFCRSGAVVEVASMIGFTNLEAFRMPNQLVKRKLMEALGLASTEEDYAKLFAGV